MKGRIHSFESFGTVDGPGIRFVVFMQGCPLRCAYCHNPDTWGAGGRLEEAEDVASYAIRYKSYFSGGGGVTLSGGEPLSQLPFVTELCSVLKREGVHVAIDTAGSTFEESRIAEFEKLLDSTDLFLLDIKHIDDDACKTLTGKSNANTLAFAKFLSEKKKPMWIRHVLVPSLTDDDAALKRLRAFIDTLSSVEKTEVLPYHTLGKVKYEKLGIEYSLKDVAPPSKERVENAKRILGVYEKQAR